MIGKTILHYKIIEKLGQGGMGVVYLAEDSKLKRQVAIKFLPQHISENSDERKRFEIEAQAAAALNHSNIATIHAIEEADNELFLVMEYIEGKELKDIVKAHRDVPQPQATDIAIQIAKGLQAAHEKNIIHRDIKSANIMITSKNEVKIMDFGLAKFRDSAQLTQVGTTIGTAAYMSPEQARSEEADHRSDIWSLGVILYELLGRELPFKGEYEAAIMFSILNDKPTPLSEKNPSVPKELEKIVNKCLEKEKEKRYQSIDQVIEDLNAINISSSQLSSIDSESKSESKMKTESTKTGLPKWIFPAAGIIVIITVLFFLLNPGTNEVSDSKKMMVVLPFQNLGSNEQEYFADGITSEITSRLSGLSGLGVIARTSAMQYKNSDKPLKQIAEELGIDYVLIGTIQWQQLQDNKKRVRVNSELINVNNSTQIWSKPYDADFADAFQLQSDIANQVASALNIKLLQNEKRALDEKLTDNPEAYDYYLRGFEYFNRSYQKDDWLIAENMFKKAVELDDQFAAAYARLANLQVDYHWFYFDRSEQNLQEAKFNIEKAKQLDPNSYIVLEAKGWYHYHGFLDYEPALREFNASLKNQPNNASVYMGIASVLRRQGKMEEAVQYFKKAVEVDPRSSLNMDQTGETLYLLRKYDEAQEYFERAISMAPDQIEFSHWKVLIFLARDKNPSKARAFMEKIKELKTVDSQSPRDMTFMLELIDGNYESALKTIDNIYSMDNQFTYYPRSLLKAQCYQLMKNKEETIRFYNIALDSITKKIEKFPDDPRFHSTLGIILAGLGQKAEAVKAGQHAVELMPISMEAWRGAWRVLNLAQIYTMVGEKQKAIELLDQLLSIPMDISINTIDLDPTWDALKDDPAYKALKNKYETTAL